LEPLRECVVDVAPFDNVDVRQAFRFIVDRKEMIELVFGGKGMLGNDIFGVFDRPSTRRSRSASRNIAKARSWLAKAGHADGLTVELVTSEIAAGVVRAAQVFAEQAKAAGVTVNIRQVTSGGVLWRQLAQLPVHPGLVGLVALPAAGAAVDPPRRGLERDALRRRGVHDAVRPGDVGSGGRSAHGDHPQMMAIDSERGGYIIPFFVPIIEAVAKNVEGYDPRRSACSTRPSCGSHDHRRRRVVMTIALHRGATGARRGRDGGYPAREDDRAVSRSEPSRSSP